MIDTHPKHPLSDRIGRLNPRDAGSGEDHVSFGARAERRVGTLGVLPP